jgi:hypothetical protein
MHTAFFAIWTQHTETWSRWKIRLSMENKDHIWHNERKYCSSLEHLAADEVSVKIQGHSYLQAVHFQENKTFWHQNLQTVWWIKVCMWQRECTWVKTHALPLTTWLQHTTITHWTCKVEGLGHKIFMDNFFFIKKTFWWLRETLHKFMWDSRDQQTSYSPDFGLKKLKMNRGGTRLKTTTGLTILVWNKRQ